MAWVASVVVVVDQAFMNNQLALKENLDRSTTFASVQKTDDQERNKCWRPTRHHGTILSSLPQTVTDDNGYCQKSQGRQYL
jgi:hypothetical protein